jgi:putative flavoprotein involved in K+ transport
MEHVETLVIGGGQAGLVMSHMLKQRNLSHLVLERHRIVERWRTERWDGLHFQWPNWFIRLPDFPYPSGDPDAYATADDIVKYLLAYADFVAPSIRCNVAVNVLKCADHGNGFIAETSVGSIRADNVVVATGPYQRAVVPELLGEESNIYQIHASNYRAPGQLPDGAVLVIGSGASGAQISEELNRAGRKVYLSVGHHRRLPRRYRGRDLVWWLRELGLDQTPVEERGADRAPFLVTGAYGGHTIDFREFAEHGIILLGHVRAAHGGVLQISPDLATSLEYGDAAYFGFLDRVDAHIKQTQLDLPVDVEARTPRPNPRWLNEPLTQLDLYAENIRSIVWATGYGVDFGWIKVPVIDSAGNPVHRRGITNVPGVYFLGLSWLSRMNSAFLSGVAQDAVVLANHIQALNE